MSYNQNRQETHISVSKRQTKPEYGEALLLKTRVKQTIEVYSSYQATSLSYIKAPNSSKA